MNENYQTIRDNFIRNEELKRLEELKSKYANFQQPDYANMSTRDALQTRFDLQKLNELQQKYGTQQMQTPVRAANYNPRATSSSAQPNVGVWSRLLQTFNPISTANAQEDQPEITISSEANPVQYGRATAKALDNYLKDYKIPEWPSYFGSLAPVIDFGRNYATMYLKNLTPSDKFFHCKANYEATSRGNNGENIARFISDSREWFDHNVKGDSLTDSLDDQRANIRGRLGAKLGKTLQETCPTFYKDYEQDIKW